MDAIKVDHLIKQYKKSKKRAVDDISFSVKSGEFFAFLGPNGAGKTTTISILTTRLSKTSGDIEIAGLELDKNAANIRAKIGIIFQNPSLDINLTGEENIRFHSILYGLYPFAPTYSLMSKEYKERINELTELIGIKESLFQSVKTYSGGMKRKLEIIRSIMHSPNILFLDEPTVGLDPESRKNVWEYLQVIREKLGITIFLTTHYLDEAESADHICIISKGKVVASGTPTEIKRTVTSEYVLFRADPANLDSLREEAKLLGNRTEPVGNGVKIFVDSSMEAKKISNMITTPVTDFAVERISLEDAYIKIIEEEEEA